LSRSSARLDSSPEMSRKSAQKINLVKFSFLDRRQELGLLLAARGHQQARSVVESEGDFWRFVGKYETMLRASGKPELSKLLAQEELARPQPYHRVKQLALRLDPEQLLQAPRGEMQAQLQQLLLVYLDFRQREKFQRLRRMRRAQRALPIARFKDELRDALQTSRVLIVAGDTGCGKSTQVPQFLYDFGYRRIGVYVSGGPGASWPDPSPFYPTACTQPRRLACVSLAKRVAHELLDDYGSRVGFQIRFERSKNQRTNILFITEGLLLRQLATTVNLDQYDALILDEIHERNLFGDFLLGVTKCLLRARPHLKLILMSATINVQLFHNYFREEGSCLVQVPGRLFPIKLHYMPPPALELKGSGSKRRGQSDRIDPAPYVQVLSLIDQKYPDTERGDVLIFVSGMNEIESVVAAIEEYAIQQAHWIVLPLHSGLALAEQDKVFDFAPEGARKCIVSTNIAETSLTVDGVRFVIDSGKVKEMSYDASCKCQRLKEFWVTKSSAEQRKGRAGRTGPGVCFRLYNQSQFEAFDAYPAPEIHRVPLDTMLLQMISMGLPDVRVFPFIQAPESEQVEQTILALKQHCALSVEEKITSLGRSLSNLPVELSIGKMLLMGCVFPDVDKLLTMAALLSVQSPLTSRAHTDQSCERGRKSFESDQGDLFTMMRCFREWLNLKLRREETRQWCQSLGIEEQRFYEVTKLRQQFQRILENSGMTMPSGPCPSSSAPLTSAERAKRHGELRHLKALKRCMRYEEPRQRKILKHKDQHEEHETKGEDMRDVDFRLRYDSRQLKLLERSAHVNRHRDMILLKLLIVSGFYPQLAVGDEFNYCKGSGQQFFHTRLKPFLSHHPNSQFVKDFELLRLNDSDLLPKPDYYTPKHQLSARHQLLCYQSLLETVKPYLMNCIRLPTAQTMLLFSFSIDTNSSLTQIVCDGWLGLDLPTPGSGLQLLKRAIELRHRWSSQLFAKLDEISGTDRKDPDLAANPASKDLWHDLLDFMALEVAYAVRRLLPADLKKLYTHKAPSVSFVENPFADDYSLRVNEDKGGLNVSDYVVYSCLAEQPWTTAMNAALRCQPWQCPHCDFKLDEFDITEQLVHRPHCLASHKKSSEQNPTNATETQKLSATSLPPNDYYCESCKCQLRLSQIDILRHRRQCQKYK
ncbi:hypothetical protein KR018_006309, partial [Drosophila ironensis]